MLAKKKFTWGLAYILICLCSAAAEELEPNDVMSIRGKHFAFVDYEYIFTFELTQENQPVVNIVNLTGNSFELANKNLFLMAQDRRYIIKFFKIDTGVEGQSITVSNVKIRPKSSFGFGLKGDFSRLNGLDKVQIKLAEMTFDLQSISPAEFDLLATKIDRINLSSPDIRDDYRVLRIKSLGKVIRASKP